MPLPASFARDGFLPLDKARKRMALKNGLQLKPLIIGTEGGTDSGKSEFILSCPGPGIVVCVDRGFDPLLDNPKPPAARRNDFAIKFIEVPLNTTQTQDKYVEYFKLCRDTFYTALANPDALTVGIDGDSDLYELQTLAEFGKLTQVWPQTRFGDLYAKRRAMIARAHDSGKIIIMTNKLKDAYQVVIGPDGQPVKESNGDVKREKTGGFEAQGFKDHDYLVNLRIRHLYKLPGINTVTKKPTQQQWGLKIMKCKANTELVGTELWGDECNFASLVQVIYPNVPMENWGL